jgi:hypothetical protein
MMRFESRRSQTRNPVSLRDRVLAPNIMRCATREGVNDSYLRRLIPLALLAPAIVEAICAGRQPIDLTTEKRRRIPSLPLE